DGRNKFVYDATQISVGSYTTFTCDIGVEKNFVDKLIPNRYFSTNTILLSIDYDYLMKRASSVIVK
ncbi:MAG: hypothetical protein AB7V77_03230, partial [Candidatus Woesearchaeota archaeon]